MEQGLLRVCSRGDLNPLAIKLLDTFREGDVIEVDYKETADSKLAEAECGALDLHLSLA